MTVGGSPSAALRQRILRVLAHAGHKICFVSAWPATQQSASNALSAMEAEGLIEGHADPDGDERRRSYSITPAGLAALSARVP